MRAAISDASASGQHHRTPHHHTGDEDEMRKCSRAKSRADGSRANGWLATSGRHNFDTKLQKLIKITRSALAKKTRSDMSWMKTKK